jgi:putative transposase
MSLAASLPPCGCWPKLKALNSHTLFDYPEEIRRVIYTTAIESLHSVIRKATNHRRLFPTDRSALKVVYPAIQQAAKKRTMPIADWILALNRFAILFEERMPLQ